MFLLFAITIFVFSFIFIKKNNGNNIVNKLFGVYLFLFGTEILFKYFEWSGYMYSKGLTYFQFFYRIPMFLYGPILYFIVRRLIGENRFKSKDFFHLIPLFLFLLISLLVISETGKSLLLYKNKNSLIYLNFIKNHFLLIPIILLSLYLVLFSVILKNRAISTKFKKYLYQIFYFYFGYLLSFSLLFFFKNHGLLNEVVNYFLHFLIILFVGLIAHKINIHQDSASIKLKEIRSFNSKYEKTGLSTEHSLHLKNKLIRIMNTEKIYLKNNVSLVDIAMLLKISRNQASQVINEHFKMSFYNFINSYRIKEAEEIFISDNLNITEVAYTTGFNSRSSFYIAFKKFTGLTPSEYLKKLQS